MVASLSGADMVLPTYKVPQVFRRFIPGLFTEEEGSTLRCELGRSIVGRVLFVVVLSFVASALGFAGVFPKAVREGILGV